MHKILVFMGTRPEAIKMAPVIARLREQPDLETVVVSTGQHREMLRQVVDTFGITVDLDLDVMRPNQGLAGLTARLLGSIDELVEKLKPSMALVQGDTTTVLAASLACFYRSVPLGHVEAGLRTGNLRAPFPEEANRVLTGQLATLHFPPTEFGKRNLLAEKTDPERVFVTGNTVIDALKMELARQERPEVKSEIDEALAGDLDEGWRERKFVLITGHRRENFGDGFLNICRALRTLASDFKGFDFVYPVHLNPNVRGPVFELLQGVSNIKLTQPQPYDRFIALLGACHMVLTDSGGIQEEAPGLGKPVLVMRDTTERPEGVDAGTVRLVGTKEERIVAEVSELLGDPAAYEKMASAENPYGDGRAAPRIVDAIRNYLG